MPAPAKSSLPAKPAKMSDQEWLETPEGHAWLQGQADDYLAKRKARKVSRTSKTKLSASGKPPA